jgi:hypothetical protein
LLFHGGAERNRRFPIPQAWGVGKFPFARREGKSDIPAMALPQRKRAEIDLRQRVVHRLAELQRSPIEAAVRGHLERNYIRDLIAGKKLSVNQKNLPRVARGLDWTVPQLLGDEIVNPLHARIPSDITTIPEIEIRAGTVHDHGSQQAALLGEDGERIGRAVVRSQWSFPSPFLRDELHMRTARAHIVQIRGDSMIDALYDGDRAIIDLDDTDVGQGGIFALVDDDGAVIVKQVELVRSSGTKRILCTSRNPNYKPFELLLEHPVHIIGRVASKITRL